MYSLIIIAFLGGVLNSSGKSISVKEVKFNTIELCEKARKDVTNLGAYDSGVSSPGIRAVCVRTE